MFGGLTLSDRQQTRSERGGERVDLKKGWMSIICSVKKGARA